MSHPSAPINNPNRSVSADSGITSNIFMTESSSLTKEIKHEDGAENKNTISQPSAPIKEPNGSLSTDSGITSNISMTGSSSITNEIKVKDDAENEARTIACENTTTRSGRLVKPSRQYANEAKCEDEQSSGSGVSDGRIPVKRRHMVDVISSLPSGSKSARSLSSVKKEQHEAKKDRTIHEGPNASCSKLNSSTAKKRKPAYIYKSKAGVDPNQDDLFDVEKIVEHRLFPKGAKNIRYLVKWNGYSSDQNTFEGECSFLTYLPIYKYWFTAHQDNTGDDSKLAIGAMIQHELQIDNVRFYVNDALFYKNLIDSNLVVMYGWVNLIYGFTPEPLYPNMVILLDRYTERFLEVTRLCPCFPDYMITNMVDTVLPMSFSYFIPFNVSTEMHFLEEDEKEFPPYTYSGLLPTHKRMNATKGTITNLINGNFSAHSPNPILCDEMRMQVRFTPNFNRHNCAPEQPRIQLQLRRHPDSYWELVTRQDIEMGTFISPICGEIVSVSEAEKCFRTEGEMIAFKHFLKFPNQFNLCLDRRRRSDFTRYIHHSCHPNCAIHSVSLQDNNDKWAPMLYLVARDHITKGTVLTVDFYSKLPRRASIEYPRQVGWDARMQLLHRRVDHVWCTCNADSNICRGVLWAEDIPSGEYGVAKKTKMITTLIGTGSFNGLDCVEREWKEKV